MNQQSRRDQLSSRRLSRDTTALYSLITLIVLNLIFTTIIFFSVDSKHPVDLKIIGGIYVSPSALKAVAVALSTPLLILPIALLIEATTVGWSYSSLGSLVGKKREVSRSTATDLMMLVLLRTPIWRGLQLIATLGLSFFTGEKISHWIEKSTSVNTSIHDAPTVVVLFVLLTTHTFLNYWNHRLEHTGVFWPHHRFHHSATEFNVFAGDRFHPGDLPTLVFSGFGIGLLQVPAAITVVYAAFLSLLRYLIHSRIDSDWGWVGRYLVLSPNHHRAHHVIDFEKGGGGNYGLIPLWDWLFGTLSPPVPAVTPIGVDHPYRHGWWVAPDLLRDSIDFFKALSSLLPGARRTARSCRAIDPTAL